MSYWRWTNMRTLSFGVELHLAPWDWHLGWKSDSELGSFFGSVCVGPIAFQVYASIGNCSSENPGENWVLSVATCLRATADLGTEDTLR